MDKMKKYLLFAGHRYYPDGGFDDFRGSFNSIDEAKEWFGSNYDKISHSYIDHWCQVVDRDTFEIVARFSQGFGGTTDNQIAGPVVTTIKDDC